MCSVFSPVFFDGMTFTELHGYICVYIRAIGIALARERLVTYGISIFSSIVG